MEAREQWKSYSRLQATGCKPEACSLRPICLWPSASPRGERDLARQRSWRGGDAKTSKSAGKMFFRLNSLPLSILFFRAGKKGNDWEDIFQEFLF
jgi:hypothetical protein